jgi:hypothetical protein
MLFLLVGFRNSLPQYTDTDGGFEIVVPALLSRVAFARLWNAIVSIMLTLPWLL